MPSHNYAISCVKLFVSGNFSPLMYWNQESDGGQTQSAVHTLFSHSSARSVILTVTVHMIIMNFGVTMTHRQ